MMQTVFWKVKDRQKLEAYYTNFDNYNFKLTESKQMNERRFHQKKRNSMPDCSRFEKMLKMLKNNIPFMEKAKIISHMSNLIS